MKIKLFSDMVCPYCYVGSLRCSVCGGLYAGFAGGTKRAEEVHRQCTVMRENLYRNLTDDEKKNSSVCWTRS